MRNTNQITEDHVWMEDMDEDQIRSIHECMKEYSRQLIDHILSDTSLIYVDGEYYGEQAPEALYNYEKWQQLKESLV